MRTQDEAMEAAKKALARSHRVNQFFWGWSWYGVVDVSLKLAGLQPTNASPWLLLVLLAIGGPLALHFQKKVLGVGFSYSVGKK